MRYIEGLPQELQYNNSATNLYYAIKHNGLDVKPDSLPTITVYNSAGTVLKASSSMVMITIPWKHGDGRAILDYDGQTAGPFQVGATLSGATSSTTAKIERVEDSGTTGTLFISNIQSNTTYQGYSDNEIISDDGDNTASAAANGTMKSNVYYEAIDTTNTSNYAIGENYYAVVVYIIDTVTYTDQFFFDVVLYPFQQPLISNEYINRQHPDWRAYHPDGENGLWIEAIEAGHVELARRIRALGNRPAFFVKSEELFPYELAFVEAEIAKRLTNMRAEERKYLEDRAEQKWSSRGEFQYDVDDDSKIEDNPIVVSSKFTR